MAAGLPSTARCFSIAAAGMPAAVQRTRSHSAVVRQHDRCRIGFEERPVMTRTMLLLAVGQRERAVERIRMRARQDRERREPLGYLSAMPQAILPPQSWPTR